MAVVVQCSACGHVGSVSAPEPGTDPRCQGCGKPLRPAPSTEVSPIPAKEAGAGPGRKIGRFEILSKLGRGAFGTVYRAYDPRLERDVALKLLHPETLQRPHAAKRFVREARAAARLQHPHIVPVFNVGREGNQLFLAAGFIDGSTLAQAINKQAPTMEAAVEVVRQLAEALAYAHKKGVVHRDVKPANVLLDTKGQAHLADFGLAHLAGEAERLTQAGAVVGTPAYMAPEQVGDSQSVPTPAADQYALGVVLYELLCGQLPFSGPPAVVLYNVVNQEPTSPRQVNPRVPADLEAICLRALAKAPKDRYGDCRELAEDLRRWAEGEAVIARPSRMLERLRRWYRRRPALAWTMTAAVGCVLLFTVLQTVSAVGLARTAAREEAAKREADNVSQSESRERQRLEQLQHDEAAARDEAVKETAKMEASLERTRRDTQRAEQQLKQAEAFREEQRGLLAQDDKEQEAERRALETITKDLIERTRAAKIMSYKTMHLVRAGSGEPLLTLGRGEHKNGLKFIYYSPDGKSLASAGYDGTARIWDASTGNELLKIKVHTNWIFTFSYCPDGTRLASAGDDGTVRVWDASTGTELFNIKVNTNALSSICYSPDGKRLASASMARNCRTVQVWDASTGKELFTLQGRRREPTRLLRTAAWELSWFFASSGMSRVSTISFSPDGARLACAGDDGVVRVWDAFTGEGLFTLETDSYGFSSICYSPDGKRLASGSTDGTVRVWDASTGKKLLNLEKYTDEFSNICYSHDGKRLVSATVDKIVQAGDLSTGLKSVYKGVVRIWDAFTGKQLLILKGGWRGFSRFCYSPDGKQIATSDSYGTVRVWSTSDGRELLTLIGNTDGLSSIGYSPDGKRLVSTSYDGTARMWSVFIGKDLLKQNGHTSWVIKLCLSPDGTRMVSASVDRTVRVWDTSIGKELLILQGHKGEVSSICYCPDGKWLATGSTDGTVRVWDASTGKELLTIKGHKGWVSSICCSSDGTRLASAGDDRTVRVWDRSTSKELLTFKGRKGGVSTICYSSDGKRLVCGSIDGTVCVLDTQTEQEQFSFKHKAAIRKVSFSNDGKLFASASDDKTVIVCNDITRKKLFTLPGHTGPVCCIAFSADSGRIASADKNGTVKIWDANTGELLNTFEGHHAEIHSIAFLPNDWDIVTADSEGVVRFWR